ncbi:MAG: CoA transferase [Chloroflexi bacterium]|nr:CoA transferase [Chloroflexota bacterium]
MKAPLEGIRVVDFGWRATAPIAARMLAWHGAEVIRIESFTRLCGMRQSPPFPPGTENSLNTSGYFNNFNSSKLAATLNLTFPDAKEIAKGLIKISDVVVENFAAGVMDKLGLGYRDLVKIKPDIVMISHALMGTSGPWKRVSGHGPNVQALAGLDQISGYPDRAPIGSGVAHTDYIVNPHHSSFAILAALYHRRRTGRGQYIDLAQYESVINATGPMMLDYFANGRVQGRIGNRHPQAAPHGVYRCRGEDDNWCAITVFADEEWQQLCQAMGRPELARDPRFDCLECRQANEDALDRIVEGWTSQQTRQDVMEQLQRLGVAAGAVQHAGDLLRGDLQMRARGHYRYPEHPEAGQRAYDGPPFRFSSALSRVERAPLLGEHNEYVYRELLGLQDETMGAHYAQGVFA